MNMLLMNIKPLLQKNSMNKKLTSSLVYVCCVIFCLIFTGCNEYVSHVGAVPENTEQLKNQNIKDLKNHYIIADDIEYSNKHYIAAFIYKTRPVNKTYKAVSGNVYALTSDNNGKIIDIQKVEQNYSAEHNNTLDSAITLPAAPDKQSVFATLFKNVGSISVM